VTQPAQRFDKLSVNGPGECIRWSVMEFEMSVLETSVRAELVEALRGASTALSVNGFCRRMPKPQHHYQQQH